jgi:hypothetical protein
MSLAGVVRSRTVSGARGSDVGLGVLCAAIPNGGEVVERVDVLDDASRKAGYTVLKGDPRFKYVSAVAQYVRGRVPDGVPD